MGCLMNRKIVGAILLSAAGLVLTFGVVGAQVANAVVRAGFHAGKLDVVMPAGPEAAHPHGLVLAATLVLGGIALYFLFGPEDRK